MFAFMRVLEVESLFFNRVFSHPLGEMRECHLQIPAFETIDDALDLLQAEFLVHLNFIIVSLRKVWLD